MKYFIRFLATASVAFLLYLLLGMSFVLPEIMLGMIVAIVTALISVRYLPFSFQTFHPLRIVRALIYAPLFIWKMIVANLHIAGIVIRPQLRIHPSIIKAKTNLTNPAGKLILTSSITLTPGTLSVDTVQDDVYVHVVDSPMTSEGEARQRIIAPFEKHIWGISE
jgi:multicomponent Na+:H+ antiporter subunit E